MAKKKKMMTISSPTGSKARVFETKKCGYISTPHPVMKTGEICALCPGRVEDLVDVGEHNARVRRWLEFFSAYTYMLEYRKDCDGQPDELPGHHC